MFVKCIPLKPHFYVVCRGIHVFLIFAPKHRLWVHVRTEATIYVLSKNKKNIKIFQLKIFNFYCVYCMSKFS